MTEQTNTENRLHTQACSLDTLSLLRKAEDVVQEETALPSKAFVRSYDAVATTARRTNEGLLKTSAPLTLTCAHSELVVAVS